MYDFIVVGSGFCGSVIAREIAEHLDKKVLVVEKRNHIAGNMYDQYNEDGVLIQKYGPHTFITNELNIIRYLEKYGKWHEYIVKAKVEIDGQLMPMPFNFKSVELFYDEQYSKKLIAKLTEAFPNEDRVPIYMLTEHEDSMISEYGNLLCEKDYIPYTAKQWGIDPHKIDKSVIARVKIALSYEDNYMQQKYQVMPDTSFTDVFHEILNHENITVVTGTDALKNIEIDYLNKKVTYNGSYLPVIYTGPIDELFEFKYGKLPYRSLDIIFKTFNQNFYQEVPFIAYPQAEGYTRITEYKYLTGQILDGKTSISVEYPVEYNEKADRGNVPYYPIICDENKEIYSKYKTLAKNFKNLYICGRLGDYKYYNMDAAIMRAFEISDSIKTNYR